MHVCFLVDENIVVVLLQVVLRQALLSLRHWQRSAGRDAVE
jgi:hypothetical protein